MPDHFADLKQIVHDLKDRDFALAIADFTHCERSYFVLIKRYVKAKSVKEKFALARLEFIRRSDTSISREWPATRYQLIGEASEIREFFGIPFVKGGIGDALQTLYARLGGALRDNIRMHLSAEEQRVVIASLSRSDSENPDRVHCYAIRRNRLNTVTGKRQQRSSFNSQKAAMLRPELYDRLKDDRTISFCFSTDTERWRSDRDIYESFMKSQ